MLCDGVSHLRCFEMNRSSKNLSLRYGYLKDMSYTPSSVNNGLLLTGALWCLENVWKVTGKGPMFNSRCNSNLEHEDNDLLIKIALNSIRLMQRYSQALSEERKVENKDKNFVLAGCIYTAYLMAMDHVKGEEKDVIRKYLLRTFALNEIPRKFLYTRNADRCAADECFGDLSVDSTYGQHILDDITLDIIESIPVVGIIESTQPLPEGIEIDELVTGEFLSEGLTSSLMNYVKGLNN